MSASPDSSPGNPRPFSFGDLGRPRPSAPRLLPPIKDPDATGELELCADDILESNDIDTFEVAAEAAVVAAAPVPVAAKSSDFEVGDLGAFDDIEVEGLAPRATERSPAPAPAAVIARTEAAPVSIRVEYTSPQPSTLIGMPAAPITSPLPLEESVILSEPPAPERTQEMKGALEKVAEAAAFLDGDMPERTQVLVRSQMPASIQGPRTLPTGHTPPPTSVHTPSALAATTPAWANGRHPASGHTPVVPQASVRPSSLVPVAVDVRVRPTMASIPAVAQPAPAPAKSGVSGLLIGGLAFAAVALIGVVGVGGYIASRTLSDKAESIAIAPAPEPASTSAAAAPAAPADPAAAAADPAAQPADPSAAAAPSSAGVDVSSLPSAPARGAAAPRAAAAAEGSPAPAPAPRSERGERGSRVSAGSPQGAPTSTGRAGAPLPPPGAASTAQAPLPASTGGAVALPPPPPKAAPAAAAATVATTGNVNVDPKLRAVVVDGAFRRVNDGVLTLSCGTHRIKVGMNDPQVVNVPCGGSVTL